MYMCMYIKMCVLTYENVYIHISIDMHIYIYI